VTLTKFLSISACLLLFLFTFLHTADNVESAVPDKSIWQTQGYGYILEVKGNELIFYDITEKYCLINQVESGEYPSSNISVVQGRGELNWGAIHPVPLTRLETLPELCQHDLLASIDDKGYKFSAPLTFDVFWSTFAEHFAFSQEINWNWNAKYLEWKKKVAAQMSEEQLAQVFSLLLTELGDAHARLESREGSPLAGHNIKWEAFRNNKIEIPFVAQDEFSSPYAFHMDLNKKQTEIISSYFTKDVKPQRLNRSFLFGQLPKDISYLSIDDMSGFTEQDTVASDLMVVDKVMKKISPMLDKSQGLVIDLRWNAGGYDLVSNRILSYLIDSPLYIGSKSIKLKSGFSQPRGIVVPPSISKPYLGPIVVLTSGLTMSAGEIFLMGLAARDNVSIIGEASNGGLSDSLPKQLPNGWTFALSNERYLDADGKNHEYSGYPVVQKHEYMNAQALKEGRDHALESAISLLQ